MGGAFYFTIGALIFTDICIANFTSISSEMLQIRYGYSDTLAGFWFSIPYSLSAGFNIILGLFCDKYGYLFPVKFAGCILMIAAHVLQIMIPDCDDACARGMIPSLMLGFSWSTLSCIMWSNIAKYVEARLLGTAFGIYALVANL